MTPIQEVYNRQNVSDMFFNHEVVVAAYGRAIDPNTGAYIGNMAEDAELVGVFGADDAAIIAAEFLRRL